MKKTAFCWSRTWALSAAAQVTKRVKINASLSLFLQLFSAIIHNFSTPEIVSGAAAVSDHIRTLQVSHVPAPLRRRLTPLLQGARARQLLANVHGHTHAARGLRVLGRWGAAHAGAGKCLSFVFCSERTPAVNPGSLSEGSCVSRGACSCRRRRRPRPCPPVTGPDASTSGDFGVMTLRRQGQGQWMVAGVELMSLDPALAKQSL